MAGRLSQGPKQKVTTPSLVPSDHGVQLNMNQTFPLMEIKSANKLKEKIFKNLAEDVRLC